ncbi:MAG: hypothetical protein AAGC55_20440, partial [Myxococcota bacterium]
MRSSASDDAGASATLRGPADSVEHEAGLFEVATAKDSRRGEQLIHDAVAAGRPYAVVVVDADAVSGDGVTTALGLGELDRRCQVIVVAERGHPARAVLQRDGLCTICAPDSDDIASLAASAAIEWNERSAVERLLDAASGSDSDDGADHGLKSLLNHVLEQLCAWLSAESGALVRGGSDDAVQLYVGRGRLAEPAAVDGLGLVPDDLRGAGAMRRVGDCLALPIRSFGLAVVELGQVRPSSTHLVASRRYIEHAAQAIGRYSVRERMIAARCQTVMRETLGYIAHASRGPVRNVQAFVGMLKVGDEELFSRQELFDYIETSLIQVAALSRDTLDCLRGSIVADLRPVVMREVLAASLSAIAVELKQRDIELRLAIPDQLTAEVDRALLARAVRNLAVYTSEGLYKIDGPWV